jgi:radical SAM family uncharacterized protein
VKPTEIESQLEIILNEVLKPARYVGGEFNEIRKPWDDAELRIAVGFPDLYDLGMPNLALAILYDLLNKEDGLLAERVYLPWPDMDQAMRRVGVPLFSLESKHPLMDFDLLALSLPYETVYTNVLALLDLAEIPLLTAERDDNVPIVIAGGHATFNPEPMADFFDAMVIGEGEEIILEITDCIKQWRKEEQPRPVLHRSLAQISGVYVPSLYQATYNEDGTVKAVSPIEEGIPATVRKRVVPQLPPPVTDFIVPNIDVVHNRAAIEIMRGCTRGCRFCQAGMITRPVRERSVTEVVDAIARSVDITGFEEVGLLSLSSSDYRDVLELVKTVGERFADMQLNIALPSLRIESVSVELMELLQKKSRRSGFTLAPEAATERMREIINKPVKTEDLLSTASEIYKRGWSTLKLYFMIGHPAEKLEDVQAIAALCKDVLAEGRKVLGGRARLNVGVSTFVPKPNTPFQWAPCDTADQVEAKQALLKREVRGKGLKLSWTDIRETELEAWLSRGDRRMGKVIHRAYKRGAFFDAWREHFRFNIWQEAFAEAGIDPKFYSHRQRGEHEVFPWDHIDSTVKKSFLWEDYSWSAEGQTRVDCRDKCFACGILPTFKEMRRDTPEDAWQCPPVGNKKLTATSDDAEGSTNA